MKNRVQLKQYVRFQLEQMSARNEHHLFEELAFELARQTVTRRLLPATGPVQAGGDGGRDFESYRTYLAATPIASSVAAGLEGDDVLVFGCTLNKQLEAKIKSDVKTMCASEPKPASIYYYAVPDLAVAKRHELQVWSRRQHGAALEIFDGQAIANLLAEPEHFWIAEQFLGVPAEMFPPVETGGEYGWLKERWLDGDREVANHADLVEVKRGLRKATFNSELKPDLGRWLALMEGVARSQNGPVQRRALYEIVVAQLRGRGTLDPAAWAVELFFDSFSKVPDPAPSEVEDATLIGSYAVSAFLRGDFSGPIEKAQGWADQARTAIDRSLAGDLGDGSRFRLLLVRGHLDFDTAAHAKGDDRAEILLRYWEQAVDIAERSPFTDVDAVATLLEMIIPAIGGHPRYRVLADRVDALVSERGGDAAGAEQGRVRALRYLEADQLVLAIDQLQRAKEGWFAGETMKGSVLAMLQLAEAYLALRLPLAARYYGAAALYSIGNLPDDDLKPLAANAAFTIANTYMLNGEGLSYMAAAGRAAEMHLLFSSNPEELEEQPAFSAAIVQTTQMRSMIAATAPDLLKHADTIIEGWSIDPAYGRAIRQMSGEKPWHGMGVAEIEGKLGEEIGQGLFGDVGRQLRFQWYALGINWLIEAEADTRIDAERIGAALQISLVDLSDEDLLIIPGNVHIRIAVGGTGATSSLRQEPDNGTLRFVITVPTGGEASDEAERTMAMVSTMVVQASAMPFADYRTVLETKMKRGLPARAFWVRPAGKLLGDVRSLMLGGLPELGDETQPALNVPAPLVHQELAWRHGPAPGYSTEKARTALTNRYTRTGAVARAVVPQLMADPRARAVLEERHRLGARDWQLINAIYNLVVNAAMVEELGGPLLAGTPDPRGVMNRAVERLDSGDIPQVDRSRFDAETLTFQLDLNVMATLKGWGLELHRQTPDSAAVGRFLDARYNNASDDIPHEDFFGWNTEESAGSG